MYEKLVDRESAFEAIKGRTNTRMADPATAREKIDAMGKAANTPVGTAGPAGTAPAESSGGRLLDSLGNLLGGGASRTRASAGEQLFKSAASAIGREVGRQIIRGVLGGIFGGKR